MKNRDDAHAPYVAPKGEADMVRAVAEALDRERKARETLDEKVRALERKLAEQDQAHRDEIARLERRLGGWRSLR